MEEGLELGSKRVNYTQGELLESSVLPDPISQFKVWLGEALDDPLIGEANAMTLATVSKDGLPDARIVLLKALDDEGFVFYVSDLLQVIREQICLQLKNNGGKL